MTSWNNSDNKWQPYIGGSKACCPYRQRKKPAKSGLFSYLSVHRKQIRGCSIDFII